jgi:alkanesulfonate monooxygenase SsuD/methylene tetrahydromethanopterin reductase-like flavin-dependent oxidoreductase (luciferase family)
LLERTVPALQQGLRDAHRTRDGFEVVCEIICAVGETDEEIEKASAGVRSLLSFYGSTPSYRPTLEVEGREDLQPTLNTMSKQGRWKEMAELIDDDLLETIAVRGTPAQCAKQIVARVGDLADRVCLYFPGYPLPDRVLAEVVSAVKAESAKR